MKSAPIRFKYKIMKNFAFKAAAISLSAAAFVGQINQTLKQSDNFYYSTEIDGVLNIEESKSLPIVKEGYPIFDDENIPGLQVFLARYIHYNYQIITVFIISSASAAADALAQKMLLNFNLSIAPEYRLNGDFKMNLAEDPIELHEIMGIGIKSQIAYTVMNTNIW